MCHIINSTSYRLNNMSKKSYKKLNIWKLNLDINNKRIHLKTNKYKLAYPRRN